MKLSEGRIGKSYKILGFESTPVSTERRLESLGMTPGTSVDVLNNKSRGTIILRMRESRYAIGKTVTKHILVEELFGPSPVQFDRNAPDFTRNSCTAKKRGDLSASHLGRGGSRE